MSKDVIDVVLAGHMGRDDAMGERLVEEGYRLHVIGQWQNPGLWSKAEVSGGSAHKVENMTDVEGIADLVQAIEPDIFVTNSNVALGEGVVDAVKRRIADKRIGNILIPCPDKYAASVESDKFFLRQIIDSIDPEYNPINFMAETSLVVNDAFDYFSARNVPVAVKPRNYDDGGVRVMNKHFQTFEEGKLYALEVLANKNQAGVEIQEVLEGFEFTLQIFTDGKTMIAPPETYDYPYREDGDIGPGTGGMGCFSMGFGDRLPFLTDADYMEVMWLMEQVLEKFKELGIEYKKVLYPTFFKTPTGIKIVEVNTRGGDPELINILDLLDEHVKFGEVLAQIAQGELQKDSISYKKLASAMLYLVSPDYAYRGRKPAQYEFTFDPSVIQEYDCKIRFGACEQIGPNRYTTVGSSRTIGLSGIGNYPWEVRHRMQRAIATGFGQPLVLDARDEVAKEEYIRNMKLAA